MLGLIWSSLSWFLVFDWPEDHPRISQEELEFLQRTRAVQPGTQNNNARHVNFSSIRDLYNYRHASQF